MLLERFKFEKRYWYPNFKTGETLLWERFLEKYPDAYDEVAYNIKVGEGAPIPEGTEENIAEDFKGLTQAKIDVIGFKNEKMDIIELKPQLRLNAPNQLKAYGKLYKKTVDPAAVFNLVLITYAISVDMETVIEGEGINVIIV